MEEKQANMAETKQKWLNTGKLGRKMGKIWRKRGLLAWFCFFFKLSNSFLPNYQLLLCQATHFCSAKLNIFARGSQGQPGNAYVHDVCCRKVRGSSQYKPFNYIVYREDEQLLDELESELEHDDDELEEQDEEQEQEELDEKELDEELELLLDELEEDDEQQLLDELEEDEEEEELDEQDEEELEDELELLLQLEDDELDEHDDEHELEEL